MEKRALGKGLSALIPEKSENVSGNGESIAYLKTHEIKRNSLQPRVNYDDDKLEELTASIKEKGVLQPILVRENNGHYEVVAGERRLRAAQALNLEEVPAIIKKVSDQEALVIALVENIQREELNPIEEARAYQKLVEEFQYTQESIAQSVGKDRSTITNILRLLKLPSEIQKGVAQGRLSSGHARALLSVDSIDKQLNLFNSIVKKGLSVRELENLIKVEGKGSARREKAEKPANPQIVQLEEGLQRLLGTKVRIDSQKKRGKIVIDYYSSEDLQRIIKLIIKE